MWNVSFLIETHQDIWGDGAGLQVLIESYNFSEPNIGGGVGHKNTYMGWGVAKYVAVGARRGGVKMKHFSQGICDPLA